MRRVVAGMFLIFLPLMSEAQSAPEIEAVLGIMGVMSVEEADAEEVERLTGVMRNPVRINAASRSSLESSGLFSAYQIASLLDYRSRHGDIMSLTELSVIDGFTRLSAESLRYFVSFVPSAGSKVKRVDADAAFRSNVKLSDENVQCNYAMKGKLSVNDVLDISFSTSRPYDAADAFPSMWTACLGWEHRYGKILVGDFNARFGQGLCVWNTMTFSNLSSPSSFMRRPSGISRSYSFTGTYAMRGIATDMRLGRWRLSCVLSSPDLKTDAHLSRLAPMADITRYFRYGHAGLTHYMEFSDIDRAYFRIPEMRTSANASFCFRGVNVFGEGMYDWVAARCSMVGGFETRLGGFASMASLVRFLPDKDEHGWAVGAEISRKNHNAVLSADVICHPSGKAGSAGNALQLKTQARWRWSITELISLELRLSERFRTWGRPFRTDIRAHIDVKMGAWSAAARLNALKCAEYGVLGYVEASYQGVHGLKLYLRQGLFRIDEWDDRIYVYERDAPGSFTVPAFYGRGVWTSAYASWRYARWGSLYVRASYTAYPMMREKKKPGKAELKLQCMLHF